MEIYLIRHTTPEIAPGFCYGQTDLTCDASRFESELERIQAILPTDIEKFYSSPLQRCTQLAGRLSEEFTIDSHLLELHFGQWENQFWNDIEPSALESWMHDFVHVRTPEGESYWDLHQRTQAFAQTLIQSKYQKIALITHAGIIRSWISYILDLPLENSFRIGLQYGAVVHVQLDPEKSKCQLKAIR